ncbi:VARLMGL domain-containing protein [Salix suchowensis]|nr:VARLMGL domain-containing protein [Salix suchowensis]
MSHSHNSGSGCFAGAVRLLLCKGSHQTHPSDQRVEPITPEFFNHVKKDTKIGVHAKVEAPVSTTPGVVARLMGLDSLPDTNWVPRRSSPESVPRSRSVNFMDYLLQLDLAQAQHRRVRTSVSFREVPALMNQENHDVYVLYLDDHDNKLKKMGSKQRKSEGISFGDQQMKQKSYEERSKNKEGIVTAREGAGKMEKNRQNNSMKVSTSRNEPKRMSSSPQFSSVGNCKGVQFSSGFVMPHKKDVRRKSRENPRARTPVKKPVNQKKVLVESKFMKRIKNRQANKDSQSDCSSEDSSTISIIGLSELLAHDAIPLPGDSWPVSSPNPPDLTDNMLINGEVEPVGIKKNHFESCNDRNKEHYSEEMRKLPRLTGEDVEESRWVMKSTFKFDFLEEMFTEFGKHILDSLLCQVVEELAEFHMETL